MPHPLITRSEEILLPPAYFGSVQYYALMSAYPDVVLCCGMPYDKRKKFVHRTEIVDTRHRIYLTVPVSKQPQGVPEGMKPRWCDYVVSDHDRWWMLHRVALESAYGRTPFFEFYAPQIYPLLSEETVGHPVTWLAAESDAVVRRLLHLPQHVVCDMQARPSVPYPTDVDKVVEYYQLRADLLGFQSGLSILDLLFNCGPESQFILKAMQP